MSDLEARVRNTQLSPFERLVLLMAILHSPEGCAWDRAQTHQTLVPYLIEETYEVVEAIRKHDSTCLREELGDLLCQIVFHAQLAHESEQFDIGDVANGIVEKLVQRHPHVFGERKDLKPGEVRDQWEKIKTESGEKKSVLKGLPASMPALTMAYRIGEKAGGMGFDWNKPLEVLDKVKEETTEIEQELLSPVDGRRERLTVEIGDLLFAVASLARKLGIDPEMALKGALSKFRMRFEQMEDKIKVSGRSFNDFTLEELENIWQRVKQERRQERQ